LEELEERLGAGEQKDLDLVKGEIDCLNGPLLSAKQQKELGRAGGI